jgi:hypothetical protein
MWLSEPYPTSPSGGSIQDQVTAYLSGLVPPDLVDTGISAFFTVTTVILAALGYHHFRRGKWLSGWLSGPSAVLSSLIAARYGVSGLPALFGVDPFSRDPKSLFAAVVVALLAAVLVAGAAWPVAAHASAYRGSPITPLDLREWAQAERLHAGGGAAAGAAVGWIAFDPLLCVAGAVIGLLVTAVVVTLRGTAARSAPTQPPAAQPEHRRPPVVPPTAHQPPVVSDEGW